MSEKELHKTFAAAKYKILFIILAVGLLSACYPVTRSKGVVKNELGQPIAGATVKIGGKSAKSAATETNADGSFEFGEVAISSHENPMIITLTVEKEGFKSYDKQLNFNAENVDEIILQPVN